MKLALLLFVVQIYGSYALGNLFGDTNVKVTNGDEDPVPVSIDDATAVKVEVQNTLDLTSPVAIAPRVPVSASGEWLAAGQTGIPSNILIHDLFFYVDSLSSATCSFSMRYVIDNTSSRTIRRWDLAVDETAELHFEAGILSSQLRFGTFGSSTCTRHWMVLGFEV